MKRIILIPLLMFMSTVYAQSANEQTYQKAKIYLNDHRIITVKKLSIDNLEASFLNTKSQEQQSLSMDKVNIIKVARGSHLLEGALYGAGTLALTGVFIDLQTDPLGNNRKLEAKEYIGLTAAGAAVGALIGSIFPKWKEVYSGGKFIGDAVPLNLGFDARNDQFLIKITIPL